MAFVYEEVKKEDYPLFDSLCWKDIFEEPIHRYSFKWCKDVARQAYLLF